MKPRWWWLLVLVLGSALVARLDADSTFSVRVLLGGTDQQGWFILGPGTAYPAMVLTPKDGLLASQLRAHVGKPVTITFDFGR